MAKKSKAARAEARAKHHRQKHRAKYMRVVQPFCDRQRNQPAYGGDGWAIFNQMIVELNKLNVKYLQTMLLYLRSSGAIHPWYGEYHRNLQSQVETMILEKTVLK